MNAWDRPGFFKFYTDEMRAWMGGYEPVLADIVTRESQRREQSRIAREKQLELGTGWGTGNLGKLSAKPLKATKLDKGKLIVRRKRA